MQKVLVDFLWKIVCTHSYELAINIINCVVEMSVNTKSFK